MGRIFFLILICCVSCKNKEKDLILDKYGIHYNGVRLKLGIPAVKESYKLSEDIKYSLYRFSDTKPIPDSDKNRHVWKELNVDSSLNLINEADYFINPVLNQWLVINHNYYNKITYRVIQRCGESEHGIAVSAVSDTINKIQGDSVLVSWDIE